jgi:hypothetical protein
VAFEHLATLARIAHHGGDVMASFREKIVSFVDDNWMVPCRDGRVMVYYGPINTQAKIAAQKKATGKDWAAAFLRYPDPKYGTLEGLYLIPAADLAKVKGGQFDVAKYPDRKMLASWFDKADKDNSNPEVIAQKPADNGLNDCAHFVTQSLAAGDIHAETNGVTTLFNTLRAMSDTKTLAKTVDAGIAENIINAGIMKPGDVIIYSKLNGKVMEHHHSVVYMGSGKIAMHTWANHPKHPDLHGDWKASVTDDHPLVTLIHFGRDDKAIASDSRMPGWWKSSFMAMPFFYYYFEKTGRVARTDKAPANLKQPPPLPASRGYWFEDAHRIMICWPETGLLELLSVKPPRLDTHLEGMWGYPLVMDKL